MFILDKYLKKIQEEQEQVTTSVAAGITPYESPHTGKPLKSSKGRPIVTEDLEQPNRICVDFDGTIHSYTKGFRDGSLYDGPTEGCKEALSFLKNLGYEIIVFTTRVSKETNPDTYKINEKLIRKWLDRYEIPFDRISAEKMFALVYIDDRGIRFSTWPDVLHILEQLKLF
jgi:hypothetical protein